MRPSRCRWLALDAREVLALLRRDRAADAQLHQLRVAADRVQRRAQLVAHHREELALRAVRRLRLRARAPRPPRARARSRTSSRSTSRRASTCSVMSDPCTTTPVRVAVGLGQRLEHHVEVPRLERRVGRALQQHRRLAPDPRLAGLPHAVEQRVEALLAHLRQSRRATACRRSRGGRRAGSTPRSRTRSTCSGPRNATMKLGARRNTSASRARSTSSARSSRSRSASAAFRAPMSRKCTMSPPAHA